MEYEFLTGFFLTDEFNSSEKCDQCNNTLIYSRYQGYNFITSIRRPTNRKHKTKTYCIHCSMKKFFFKDEYLQTFLRMLSRPQKRKELIKIAN